MTDPDTDPARRTPPAPSRGLGTATVVLVGLWFVVTIGARPLVPIVATFVERVEVGLGLDVSGPRGT